ncbi:DUF4386 domain-containing protein [Candidatus Saccharibacteria bacterium]|nr:DUF4386 domain-containing protein [Candidatus Saccharibacteria bacterium]
MQTLHKPWHRKISLTAGVLYLLTFVSIPTLALYGNAKDAAFITGTGSAAPVLIGALLEVIVALAGIGTAVVLFGILKKQNQLLSVGLIASRTVEAAGILAGVACMLALVALRDKGVGPEYAAIGNMLATLYHQIFLVSQSLMPAFNDLILGYLLYKSGLVPQSLAKIGIIGGPILFIGFLAVILGLAEQNGTIAGLSALPVAVFELVLGLWLVFKGFNPAAAEALKTRDHDSD